MFCNLNSLSRPKKSCTYFIGLIFIIYGFISLLSPPYNEDSSSLTIPNVPGCQPAARKIAFLKTFKCGTTTLLHLFKQYLKKFNLTEQKVLLEKMKTGPFNRSFVVNPSIKGDFMMQHFIWNKDEIVALMGSNVAALTILRNPINAFESFYSFVNLQEEFGMNITKFIQFLRENDPKTWRDTSTADSAHKIMRGVYNYSISHSLGMSYESILDDAAIDKHILKLEKEFDLVMITEKMEESFILLRYLMCWQLEDILIFDYHVRSSDAPVKLSEEDHKELKRWLKADLKIYKHFYKVFDARVAHYPGNMAREMKQRIIEREKRRDECIKSRNETIECHGAKFRVAKSRTISIENNV